MLPGAALARGAFAGAAPDSKPARRLAVLMTGDQNLEVRPVIPDLNRVIRDPNRESRNPDAGAGQDTGYNRTRY